jgi:hypothetical protein
MKNLKEWEVEHLEMNRLKVPQPILKEMSHIHFPGLTTLMLMCSHVESVDLLAHLQMPHLKVMSLGTCLRT